jgi:hypothetical protein
MFDRGLVSVDEDFGLLLAQDRVLDTVGRILNADRKFRLPDRIDLRPHQQFLEFHRREIFKGQVPALRHFLAITNSQNQALWKMVNGKLAKSISSVRRWS